MGLGTSYSIMGVPYHMGWGTPYSMEGWVVPYHMGWDTPYSMELGGVVPYHIGWGTLYFMGGTLPHEVRYTLLHGGGTLLHGVWYTLLHGIKGGGSSTLPDWLW